MLVAPLTFAVYNVLYKPLLGRYDLPALTAAGGLAGSLLFLPFENTGAIDRFGALGAGSWIALAALGLGATLGGYVTWSIALRGLEPSRAMSYLYCVPPLAVAIGALFLDEPVTLWLLLGGALVIGGVAVAQRGPARKAGMPPSALHRGRRRATMSPLRKRFTLAGGVATLALLALPSLASANPGTGPELVQRSGRLVVVHADRDDGSSTQRWMLGTGATSLPVRVPADVWVDPGTPRPARGHAAGRDARARGLADAPSTQTGLAPLAAAAARPIAAPASYSAIVIPVGFSGGPDLDAAGQPDAAGGVDDHVQQPARLRAHGRAAYYLEQTYGQLGFTAWSFARR